MLEDPYVNPCRAAVLGGDQREYWIAHRLAEDGHDVAIYGVAVPPTAAAEPLDHKIRRAETPTEAVAGAQWLVCPSPGLGPGDAVYAPFAPAPFALDEQLLSATDAARGGIVLGRATPTLAALLERLSIPSYEMKDDRALAIMNATPVAEAVVSLLVQNTDRILSEYHCAVIGYGATGAAITDALLALNAKVTVIARNPASRARAAQRGADATADYEERVEACALVDIIINTAPDTEAVPRSAFGRLADRLVIDIASPPGGLDHDAATAAGLNVHWARGLAGGRAPRTVGDAQYALVRAAMNGAPSRQGGAT